MSDPSILEDTITEAEIATACDVHPSTVRRWVSEGKLPKPVGPSKRPPRYNRKAVRRALSGETDAA